MPSLTDPVDVVEGVRAPSRVLFGPHVTNLGDRRAPGARHVAYYRERAAGGTGILVTETASVHPADHPYERAPLATECGPGWARVALACRPFGTVVLAGLGHEGGQGSSAYSQSAVWAPSRVADPVSRELPAEMEQGQIDEVLAGFAEAGALAVHSGLAGVEIDAGPRSLLRQFLSGLTNRRQDAYGSDRLLFIRQVLAAVRDAIGRGVLALRLSCDELAPWGGLTPDQAEGYVAELAETVDVLVVVRGGPFSTAAYRPDAHTPPAFNRELTRRLRATAAGRTLIALQGSVVDVDSADSSLNDGTADLVEMTRRQIAEPRLVELVRAGIPQRARPCLLCNQACQVHDARNLPVSCVTEPRSGHEWQQPPVDGYSADSCSVVVVGGGPAGLEAARVLALCGHPVRLVERTGALGGTLRLAAVGAGRERLALLTDWLEAEVRRLGVQIEVDRTITPTEVDEALDAGNEVVVATGSRPLPRTAHPAGTENAVVDVLDLLVVGVAAVPPGRVVVEDPVGGPVGVAAAEWLAASGRRVTVVTPDPVVGSRLAQSGDLVAANTRLARAGIDRETHALVREVAGGVAVLRDVWTGQDRRIPCDLLIDCGPRVAEQSLNSVRRGISLAGDCVAPRSALEAVLEGRRRALEISSANRFHPSVPAVGSHRPFPPTAG